MRRSRNTSLTSRIAVAALAAVVLFSLALIGCDPPAKHMGYLAKAILGGGKVRRSPLYVADVPYGSGPRQVIDIMKVQDPEPAPVFVFVHGGYWQSGSRKMYSIVAETMRREGFVTALVEYRVYPEVTYPEFVRDVGDAVLWVLDHIGEYGGDPKRVVVVGHSAGSHLVAMNLLVPDFNEQFFARRGELAGAALLSGAYDFERDNLLDLNILHNVMGTAENFAYAQPIKHLRADLPPVLVLNGSEDPLTSEAQAARFAKGLADAGAPVTYAKIPGGDHHTVVLDMLPGANGPSFRQFLAFAQRVTDEE
jgi:acetyl esterase/lipase